MADRLASTKQICLNKQKSCIQNLATLITFELRGIIVAVVAESGKPSSTFHEESFRGFVIFEMELGFFVMIMVSREFQQEGEQC